MTKKAIAAAPKPMMAKKPTAANTRRVKSASPKAMPKAASRGTTTAANTRRVKSAPGAGRTTRTQKPMTLSKPTGPLDAIGGFISDQVSKITGKTPSPVSNAMSQKSRNAVGNALRR